MRPYFWIPSLYIGEALPFSAVMLLSVLMFKEQGLSDSQITLYTGWLGLPWVIKPIWSPFIDNLKTKRWWILTMQFVMGVALASVAFTLELGFWLQATLAVFMLVAFSSATHDISADGFYIIALEKREQEFYVGVRNTFYRIGMIVGQGAMVMLADYLSWNFTFIALGGMMLLLALFHRLVLPNIESAVHERFDLVEQFREFGATLMVFLSKPYIISSILFILLFRLPEGLLTKIVPLFLTRSLAEGGLELSKTDFGFIYGTLGTIGLLAGGIIGGIAVSRWGLRRCLWPLVLCITLPDVVYVYLSYAASTPLWLVASCLCVEQLGYGLGFAAYTLFLITFSRGERSTAVFSICTAGQYLGGVMLPGMLSGYMSEGLGYQQFFVVIMLFCLVTFAVTAFLKIPADK